jgi:exonuclease III
VKIASVNLNKGLLAHRRTRLDAWLARTGPDLALFQEPITESGSLPSMVAGLELVDGNHLVAAYARAKGNWKATFQRERWQRLSGHPESPLLIDNVYLPHELPTLRQGCLDTLASSDQGPRLVVGDFNMAPRPEDGRHGERESHWTGVGERAAFVRLLASGLRDLGSVGVPEFTFERLNRGAVNRFRCDLALLSSSVGYRSFMTDHSTRLRADSATEFTDHSGIIVELAP